MASPRRRYRLRYWECLSFNSSGYRHTMTHRDRECYSAFAVFNPSAEAVESGLVTREAEATLAAAAEARRRKEGCLLAASRRGTCRHSRTLAMDTSRSHWMQWTPRVWTCTWKPNTDPAENGSPETTTMAKARTLFSITLGSLPRMTTTSAPGSDRSGRLHPEPEAGRIAVLVVVPAMPCVVAQSHRSMRLEALDVGS